MAPSKFRIYKPGEIDLDVLAARAESILHKKPFAWQLKIADAILQGNDVIVDIGTGSGKTLCFALPLLKDKTDMVLSIAHYQIWCTYGSHGSVARSGGGGGGGEGVVVDKGVVFAGPVQEIAASQLVHQVLKELTKNRFGIEMSMSMCLSLFFCPPKHTQAINIKRVVQVCYAISYTYRVLYYNASQLIALCTYCFKSCDNRERSLCRPSAGQRILCLMSAMWSIYLL